MGVGAFCFVAFLIVGGVQLVLWANRANRDKVVAAANATYQQALSDLRADPGNGQIRTGVLAYGRIYANTARDNGQRTIFDEMALANDLASIPVPLSVAPATVSTNADERLRQLGRLRDQALISVDEYAARRQQIISEV